MTTVTVDEVKQAQQSVALQSLGEIHPSLFLEFFTQRFPVDCL